MNSDEKTTLEVQHFTTNSELERTFSCPILVIYTTDKPNCKKYELTQPITIVGRQRDRVHIWIDDPSVSRQHCRIDYSNDQVLITDLGSSNHTYVNMQRIENQHPLRHGDVLRLGSARLRYYSRGTIDQSLFEAVYGMAIQDRQLEILRREYFLVKLGDEFAMARKKSLPLSLLFLDLDHFKSVNDRYGHDAGDYVLRATSDLIKSLLEPQDSLGRYGGEEFCILMEQSPLHRAVTLAERIRAAVASAQIHYRDQLIPITISIGVASITPDMTVPSDLLRQADNMVYRSKQLGRNCVSVSNHSQET
jgi:diguanylate cyclase (GGDEF)-like protein